MLSLLSLVLHIKIKVRYLPFFGILNILRTVVDIPDVRDATQKGVFITTRDKRMYTFMVYARDFYLLNYIYMWLFGVLI